MVIALVVTPEGFPLAYEVMPGNTADKTTLKEFLAQIEKQYGKAQRIWIMDRGIPTEEVLAEMRAADPPVHYLVGTPRARVRQTREQWQTLPWQRIKDTVEVKLFREGEELYVVAKSGGRQEKEIAMRRKKLARLLWTLRGLRREGSRDRLLLRLGAAKSKAGRAAALVEINVPAAVPTGKKKDKHQKVEAGSFTFRLNQDALQDAELYDGHYLLRSNLSDKEPEWLWKLYLLLVEIEAVFKTFKNDLGLRPIYHSVAPRVEAHIFVCFLVPQSRDDAAAALERAGAGTDAAGSAGDAGRRADAGPGSADQRRALAAAEPLHAAGEGGGTVAGAAATATARTTPAAPERATHADDVSAL